MKRRKLVILACLGLVLSLLVIFFFYCKRRDHRINEENYRRIQVGMSEEEVEAILGHSGDYGPGKGIMSQDREPIFNLEYQVWKGREFAIEVFFDRQNRVCVKRFDRVTRSHVTWFEWFRYLIHL